MNNTKVILWITLLGIDEMLNFFKLGETYILQQTPIKRILYVLFLEEGILL